VSRQSLGIRGGTALLAAALAAGCGGLAGVPASRAGWLTYRAGALAVDLPERWRAKGDSERISAAAPGGSARVTLERVEQRFASEAACLARAEQALARGASALERGRRHPTRIGGRPAVMAEGDRGAWHVWAWAACDGGEQYRLSFVGVSPLTAEVFEAQRGAEQSLRFDGSR